MDVIVGREAEVTGAVTVAERSLREHTPAVVTVLGDAGSGKSVLLRAVAERLGRLQVECTGYLAERSVPFAGAGPLLRALLPRDTAVAGHAGGTLELLERVHRRARRQPLVIVADDLQWLDEQSGALLHYLLRGSPGGPGLVLLAATRHERHGRALVASLEALVDDDRRRRCELGPLPLEAGISLARRHEPGLSREDALQRWRRAGGSPFWLAAIAGPGEGSALLHDRLDRVDADAVELFVALVTAGRPTSPRELTGHTGWAPERLAAALDALATTGLVRHVGGEIAVLHDLIRELAERELPTQRLRASHLRWADVLTGTGVPIESLLLALEHRHAAGEPAVEVAEAVLAHPRRRFVGSREMGRLISELLGAPVDVQLALGDLAFEIGELLLARDRYAVAMEASTGEEHARAALGVARTAYELAEPDAALAAVTELRSVTDDERTTLEADLLEASVLRWHLHQPDAAARLTDRVLGRIGSRPDVPDTLRFEAVSAACHDALIGQDVEQLTDHGRTLVSLSRRLPEHYRRRALSLDANARVIAGDVAGSLATASELVTEARRSGDPVALLRGLRALALGYLIRGEPVPADEVSREAVSLEDRVGVQPDAIRARVLSARAQLSIGDWASAVAELEALEASEPDPHFRLGAASARLMASSWFGTPSAAAISALLDRARSYAAAARCPRCRCELSARAVEAWARGGWFDEAEKARTSMLDVAREPWLALLRARAEALVTSGHDPSAAITDLQHLAGTALADGAVSEAWWIGWDRSRLLSAQDPAAALDVLRHLEADADRRGAANERALAAAMLRKLGVRTRRPTSAAGRPVAEALLSDRELEVARLVAGGASNPEIASTLFLSRKTIERHVSAILRKLGVRNRTELAGRLRDLGLER